MSKNKTEQTAQRLVDQFMKSNNLIQFVNDTCEATAHYARLSGTIRYMFQEELLRKMKESEMANANTATSRRTTK